MDISSCASCDHVRCSANSPCARYGIIRYGRHFLCTAIPLRIEVHSNRAVNSGFATWVVRPVELARLGTGSLAHV